MAFLAKEDGQITMVEYPSLKVWHSLPAHVTACYTLALDPRGRYACQLFHLHITHVEMLSYLASGGADGFVNLFDTTEFIATKAVPTIECVYFAQAFICAIDLDCSSGIRTIAFSYDGEYIAAGCAEQSSVYIVSACCSSNKRLIKPYVT